MGDITVFCEPDIKVEKTPDGGEVTAGDAVVFTIQVTNLGPGTATNVFMVDALEASLAPWNLVSVGPGPAVKGDCQFILNTLDCTFATMADGAVINIVVSSAPTDPDECGRVITNTADVGADNETLLGDNSDDGDITLVCLEIDGRMTGGGSVFDDGDRSNPRTTHGFELHCDPDHLPNHLEINWPKEGTRGNSPNNSNRFHLTLLTSAVCTETIVGRERPPTAGFDTYEGTGDGLYNGVAGATIVFTLTDFGQPGVDDIVVFLITDAGGDTVLNVSDVLQMGNHQAHRMTGNHH